MCTDRGHRTCLILLQFIVHLGFLYILNTKGGFLYKCTWLLPLYLGNILLHFPAVAKSALHVKKFWFFSVISHWNFIFNWLTISGGTKSKRFRRKHSNRLPSILSHPASLTGYNLYYTPYLFVLCVFCMHGCLYSTCVPGALGSQRRHQVPCDWS